MKGAIIVIIAILALLGSVIYYSYDFSTPPTIETLDDLFDAIASGEIEDPEMGYVHNGFVFVRAQDGTWITRAVINQQEVQIPVHFGPRELVNVTWRGSLNGTFYNSTLYITFEPNSTQMQYIALSATELSLNFAEALKIYPTAACAYDDPSCLSRPIRTCDSVNSSVVFIKHNENFPDGRVDLRGNCVVLEGNEWGMVKAVDAFLLEWYGIL